MLLLLSVKIPYYDGVFQKTLLGHAGFPRVYGGLALLWLIYRLTKERVPAPAMDSPVS